ncbi:MAG: diversity-generating retroelement protein bAvd family protein [Candidatus Neomarinimicrobiota bacterium]|nr:MAG: diversity-generating retroelement protein bAvd family protein [Candidatus Neomarinimicrobiota bacterium]
MHRFKELVVWQKSRELVKDIYQLTSQFPTSEMYGLTSQIQRSVISIPSNIAEGSGKSSKKDFIRFLEIAYSSSYELESHLLISIDLGFISTMQHEKVALKLDEIQKMIYGLIQKMKENE